MFTWHQFASAVLKLAVISVSLDFCCVTMGGASSSRMSPADEAIRTDSVTWSAAS